MKVDKVVDLEIELANLQETLRARTRSLMSAINSKKIELENFRRDCVLEALASKGYTKLEAIDIGDWDCELSPIGVCAYDMNSEFGTDNCLFCHQPDERK